MVAMEPAPRDAPQPPQLMVAPPVVVTRTRSPGCRVMPGVAGRKPWPWLTRTPPLTLDRLTSPAKAGAAKAKIPIAAAAGIQRVMLPHTLTRITDRLEKRSVVERPLYDPTI